MEKRFEAIFESDMEGKRKLLMNNNKLGEFMGKFVSRDIQTRQRQKA